MRKLAVTLAVLVVGAGLVAGLPASAGALGDPSAENRDRPGVHAREPPDLPEQWRRTYGGSGHDVFSDLVRTRDGGYLLVGWTERETTEAWVVKTDGDGNREWSRTLGGAGSDRFWGVVRTPDGYLLAGRDGDNGAKGWVVEVGPDGDVLRERTYGPGAFYAVARANESASDGNAEPGYLLAGWTSGDGAEGWVVALDQELSAEWRRNFSTPEGYRNGYLRAVVPTDSGYYLAGKVEGDSDDGWALKLDAAGHLAWQTTVGGPARDDVWAAVNASNDSTDAGFVLVGETESHSDGPRDGWLVKFGPGGAIEWEARPGGAGTQWLDSAMRTGDGYLFTGGSTAGPIGSADGWVLRTDATGNATWERHYGTPKWDKAWPAIRAHGEGYVLAGRTAGDGAAAKDGMIIRIGNTSVAGGTTDESAEETAGRRTSADEPGEGTADQSGDETRGRSADTSGTTGAAMGGDTATATTERGVPGFGVGAALLALAAVLLARRR